MRSEMEAEEEKNKKHIGKNPGGCRVKAAVEVLDVYVYLYVCGYV